MPTTDDCMRCTKPCPQAKLAHETAKGRMYATNELLSYVKRVDSGQLVEVVRCEECKHCDFHEFQKAICWKRNNMVSKDDFCSFGERKEGEIK